MIQSQLDYFGKEAAQRYLESNESLTDSIVKIASDNNLNRAQINRVVETANTSTYLSLFKTAEEKYIEFPVADAEKVAQALNIIPGNPEVLGDYDAPPIQQLTHIDIFPVSEDTEEKTASVNETERLRNYQTTKYALNQIMEKMAQLSGTFSEETSDLRYLIKEAVLTGQSLGHIKVAMEQYLPGKLTEVLFKDIKDNLGILNPNMSIPEKVAEVNSENKILKKLKTIHDTTSEYEKYAGIATAIGKGVTTLAKGLGFFVKRPKLTAGIAGVGIAGAAGYTAGVRNTEAKNSAFNVVPKKYQEL